MRVKVADGFGAIVLAVLSATNESAADAVEADDALVDAGEVVAEDFSTGVFGAVEGGARLGAGAAGDATVTAGDCAAAVDEDGIEEAPEAGAELWER
jgi:hypothetical protein